MINGRQAQLVNGQWVDEKGNDLISQGWQPPSEGSPELVRAAEEERSRIAWNASRGLDSSGAPIRPEFQSLIDPNTGQLSNQYQVSVGNLGTTNLSPELIDPSKLEGYQSFRKEALRTGPSQYAQLQEKRLEQERLDELGRAARQSSSGIASARSGLAMRGGLSSGSRERLASQGLRDLINARQNIGKQSGINRLQLLSDDERNRLSLLSQIPGMETDLEKFNVGQKTSANQFNIGQKSSADRFNIEAQARAKEFNVLKALEENAAKRGSEMSLYQEQLKKFGNERQAQATERSGGGGK